MTPAPTLSEADLVQSICRESFAHFVREFWGEIVPEPLVWNWHIPFLCDELQGMAERVFKRLPKDHDLIVNIPPGTTKSTICSIMFPAWVWTRDPSLRVISASYENSLSLNFARRSRDLVECERYRATFCFVRNPHRNTLQPSTKPTAFPLELRDDQNAKGHYETVAGGDRKAVGTGGNITGSHGHIIIVDDPLNPREAASEVGLASINTWMDETLPSRKVDKAMSPTILIMQRLHQDDPTGHWLARSGRPGAGAVRHICLPERLRPNLVPASLASQYAAGGGLLDPVRLSEAILAEQRAALGSYGYACQYEQSPMPLGGGLFDVAKIRQELTLPKDIEWTEIVRYWDKAGTEGGGANTAGVKMGRDRHRRIWILHVAKGQWGIAERNAIMRKTAEADGQHVRIGLEQEPGSGGKESAMISIRDTFAGFRVAADRPTGDKATRAEPFAGQVGIGNVYAPAGAPWLADYLDELRYFPSGARKDQVDASSGAFMMLCGGRPRVGAL